MDWKTVGFPTKPSDQLSLYNRLKDLEPLGTLSMANLGAGNPDSAFAQQVSDLRVGKLYNVEIHPKSLSWLAVMPHSALDTEFVLDDMHAWALRQNDRSVDICFMADSLEHLDRQLACSMLSEMKRIARKRVVIWLPWGECPQEPYAENPHQRHLSTWYPGDPEWKGWEIEVFSEFHTHHDPPVDAGWAIWDVMAEDE